LVIEDNPMNLELVTDVLEASGFAVLRANDAREGIGLAREQRPDLVLMDLGLPDMDGMSATRALKADPATCSIRIIALTARAMKGDEEMAFQAGCDGYLTKPIEVRTFADTVASFLSETPAR
jgi:CheY-like chemotaxis protein